MEVLEKAKIVSPYSDNRGSYSHTGVDVLSNVNNRNVRAVARGKVIEVQNRMEDSFIVNQKSPVNLWAGNYVVIEHSNGYVSRYNHLKYNSITVNVGDIVEEGHEFAVEGESGYATGVHLDFEVKLNGKFVDPTQYALGNATLPGYAISNSKTVEELANEVIAGKWGNGVDRKNRLTNAGYDYNVIQNRVNEISNSNNQSQLKSVDEIAREVIRGNWGNGHDRRVRLESAGYNYDVIQTRVNELL